MCCLLYTSLHSCPGNQPQGDASSPDERCLEQRRGIHISREIPSVENHGGRLIWVLGVVQRSVPEHSERLDDVGVGAVAGVLQDLVDEILPVGIIVNDLKRNGVPSKLACLLTGHHSNIAYAVKLFSNGLLNAPLRPELFIEVIDRLKLDADDFY